MANDDLKRLKYQRGAIKTQLKLFEKILENDDESESYITNIQRRLERIEPLLDKFNDIQTEIDLIEETDAKSDELESFQNLFFILTSKAAIIITNFSDVKKDEQNTNLNHVNASYTPRKTINNVKLPRIELPTFDGNVTQWREFSDSFQAMVHTNEDLSQCQKLCYLKASLKNEPADMLRALQTTDSNYAIAWNLLGERYNNKRNIVNTHVLEILNLEPILKESSLKLRQFIVNLQNHMQCLKSLDQPIESWDAIILPIALSKLDFYTIREWQNYVNSNLTNNDDIPTFNEFISFLSKRQNTLESISTKTSNTQPKKPEFKSKQFSKSFIVANMSCLNCKGEHFIQNCESYLKLKPNQRIEKIKDLKLCLNCLRKGHYVNECKSSTCRKCNKKHNTSIHLDMNVKNDNKQILHNNKESGEAQTSQEITSNHSSLIENSANSTLLSTAIVNGTDKHNHTHALRALLDSGSQSNFITEGACKKLNLKMLPAHMTVTGITQAQTLIKHQVKLNIKSRINNFQTDIQCFVLPRISNATPATNINFSFFEIPSNIQLADPTFNQSSDIDLLLGNAVFWNLLCVGQIQKANGITLQKTKFGWIVSGNLAKHNVNNTKTFLSLNTLYEELQQFWKVDEFLTKRKILTEDEEYCETFFSENTTRDIDGKFIVKIPFKENISELGNSLELAKNRFLSLESRFNKDTNYKQQYMDCIKDYKTQRHMSKSNDTQNLGFFLPHHAVIKADRTTTKLRVVFDGSCKLNSGISINSAQHIGPTLQDSIFSIVARFRTHEYVITADIAQMYRQIWVHPNDRKYQQLLWRDSSDKPFTKYELNTVTFGTASAPFLAIRCLHEIAKLNERNYPNEAQIIRQDFYVDDLLTGVNSVEQIIVLKRNLCEILDQYGFKLRKWKSNILTFDEGNNQLTSISNETNKTLGILWNSKTDHFTYAFNSSINNFNVISKRTILSTIAQLFDPIGFLSPIIVKAKLIIQQLWQLNISWDESIPSNLNYEWLQFKNDMENINRIFIPRHILVSNTKNIEIHGFSDASERAYGTCIYIKSTSKNGEIKVSLLTAKSRVAPLKKLSLPRLELLGAVLLAELINKLKNVLNLKIDHEYYWSDSTIVLNWIQAHPSKWITFVANRISQIQSLTSKGNWKHVKSKENPADLISRGLLPSELLKSDLWWNGPKWLLENQYSNHETKLSISETDIPEHKTISKTLLVINEDNQYPMQKFSKFIKLQRVTALCLRFINNCSHAKKNIYGIITSKELDNALLKLVRIAQMESFPKEYHDLTANKTIHTKSNILSLNPFIDKNGIIRVGGRITHSEFPYDKRHPMLLSHKHHLTQLIFGNEHLRLMHAGPTLLLNSTREKFWTLSGRNLAKKIFRNCVKCIRFNSNNTNVPIMADLPKERITPTYPFYTVGIDYAGPLFIKNKQGRGCKVTKCYISLFICLTTKAIHLEAVSSLSTEAFLATFRRFVARRGKPLHVYSDNGSNFKGANSEIQEMYEFLRKEEHNITENLAMEGITWHFIPPHAPNFGGLWEAGIKSTKFHLKRVMQNASLTFEDLSTVLAQIESILNSRPLSPLTSDPNDLQALTPAHFLIGRPYTSMADPDIIDVKKSRLSRYQYLQQLTQHFWSRWSKEYLPQLQQRVKWKKQTNNVEIGTMVLLKEDNLPPAIWKLGRIIKIHTGQDGAIRVVTLKTTNGIIKRPVSKLCVLNIN